MVLFATGYGCYGDGYDSLWLLCIVAMVVCNRIRSLLLCYIVAMVTADMCFSCYGFVCYRIWLLWLRLQQVKVAMVMVTMYSCYDYC